MPPCGIPGGRQARCDVMLHPTGTHFGHYGTRARYRGRGWQRKRGELVVDSRVKRRLSRALRSVFRSIFRACFIQVGWCFNPTGVSLSRSVTGWCFGRASVRLGRSTSTLRNVDRGINMDYNLTASDTYAYHTAALTSSTATVSACCGWIGRLCCLTGRLMGNDGHSARSVTGCSDVVVLGLSATLRDTVGIYGRGRPQWRRDSRRRRTSSAPTPVSRYPPD
jgi:hypothetical protein